MSWCLWIERTCPSPAEGLARDEALLRAAERPVLRLWRNSPCLVIGRADARLPQLDRAVEHFARQGVPVLRRASGGTAVWHDAGIFNISVVVPAALAPRGVHRAFESLAVGMVRALAELGLEAHFSRVPDSYCDGPHNLVVGDKKVAGLAQLRRRSGVLVHASVLVATDLERMHDHLEKFYRLAGSPRRFARAGAANLAQLLGRELGFSECSRAFARGYELDFGQG